jgi:signal recognition particle GTPase
MVIDSGLAKRLNPGRWAHNPVDDICLLLLRRDTMNLIYDHDNFEKLQDKIIKEIANSIKNQLLNNNISIEVAKEITADTTFEIAAIIDGSLIMELEGKKVEPILTFKNNDEELIWDKGSSWMHEVVYGWVYNLFPDKNHETKKKE